MSTELHWVEGPWPGKLALASRPRGGDWLGDEIAGWQRHGVNTICSLLTEQEEQDLELEREEPEARAYGMTFLSIPIRDREVPDSGKNFSKHLQQLDSELTGGKNVVLHCRQGIGRTGLVAACLLIARGFSASRALEQLSAARCVPVPETAGQRLWIENYAESLLVSR